MANAPEKTQPTAPARPAQPKSERGDPQQPNEGEGNRTAAREYNAATQKYVGDGRVEKAAREAKRAVDGEEGEELREAEKEGRSHAKEHDA